jgi:hypothetical protein
MGVVVGKRGKVVVVDIGLKTWRFLEGSRSVWQPNNKIKTKWSQGYIFFKCLNSK